MHSFLSFLTLTLDRIALLSNSPIPQLTLPVSRPIRTLFQANRCLWKNAAPVQLHTEAILIQEVAYGAVEAVQMIDLEIKGAVASIKTEVVEGSPPEVVAVI